MPDERSKRPRSSDVDVDLVEWLLLEAPDLDALARVANELAELVRTSTVRIIDLACVTRRKDGRLEMRELEQVASLSALLGVEGEVGGRFSTRDLKLASTALSPGTSALVLLVEDRWLERVSQALRHAGGRVLGGERVDASRVGYLEEPTATGPDSEEDDGASSERPAFGEP
jgi:uncharacterized membrane protein